MRVTLPGVRQAAALATAALMAATGGAAAYVATSFEAAQAAGHDTHSTHSATHSTSKTRTAKAIRFRNQMRKLWEDHIVWTRQFIVSAVADLPDTDTAAGRLLRNQDHIGNAIKPYFGNAAGEALSELLREHILIAADILSAAKSGDSEGVEEANARWHDNANEIADFLASANPTQWPQGEMREMMAEHLQWTLAEAVARLNADWNADVAAYNRVHRDILHMADMLSLGIIKRFPGRF